MKKNASSLFVVVGLLVATGCGGGGNSSTASDDEIVSTTSIETADTSTTEAVDTSATEAGDSTSADDGTAADAGDIETWLIEVGNDFPQAAKCVAEEMDDYSVADFEKSFDGELNEPFETELDAAYEMCDAKFGINTDG